MGDPSPTCGGTGTVLPLERAKASFPVDVLQALIRGDSPALAQKHRDELFAGAPFDDSSMDVYRSYAEKFERRLERAKRAFEIVRDTPRFLADHSRGKVNMSDMFSGGASAGSLHFGMFLTYLETQGSPEQLKKWRGKARQGLFLGCYAQTELGHGSNVRGIETLATFDEATDEWVVHSPTLTSLKWWPTGMYSATHGMVFARLIIAGKDYGFHGFLVQFRDDEGNSMPGVEVGEMGPKLTGESVNIGYARFTNVRVPRDRLFAKGVTVSREGVYTAAPPKLSRFKYISMMQIRARLVRGASLALAQAATIAVRYSCVRKQGFKESTSEDAVSIGENTVMDYQMQQYRTMKAVSLAYMFHWNGKYVMDYLSDVQGAIGSSDAAEVERAADEMPELHATLAGLKATSTLWAHNAMEDLRKACGGQGYLLSSGIAGRTVKYADAPTVEGEQVIMSLQVARFLLKSVDAIRRGQSVAATASYLKEPSLQAVDASFFAQGATAKMLLILADRSRRMAEELRDEFDAAQRAGATFDEALNAVAVTGFKASECHSFFVMAKNNAAALERYIENLGLKSVMQRLFELAVLQQVRESAGDWIDILDSKLLRCCHSRIKELLAELRPDAVSLVDSFGFTDAELKSTLGRYDGNVYEAIYLEAQKSPLNQSPKMLGWERFAPVLDLDILREGMQTQRSSKL